MSMLGPRALVVEDEPRMLRLVRAVLESDGYEVRTAASAGDALVINDLWHPDVIFLDILLPGDLDGYELCQRFRAASPAPVIMLTGLGETGDKVKAFEAGADDYVTKPFASRELLARARAVLRRCAPPHDTLEPIIRGAWVIDPVQKAVTLGGREIALTATEFRLLYELARHANRVVAHESLLDAVWGPEYRGEIDYLRTYVRRLRGKVEDDPSHPYRILSRVNVGYMLVAG